ncbi:MAG: hypothetical protein M2R45_03799 [Verrucomicrobia subdivision 3 bacterium]|nr:hypothetical protein [Limisphaerales bacterium]MCS1416760.1 hypothetical protein [Limisphaerales bacterium]
MPNILDACSGRWLAGITSICLLTGSLSGAPVIPGIDRLSENSDTASAFLGEILIGELGCTHCHQAGANHTRLWARSAPDLNAVGSRVTPHYLRRFLTSTHTTKPGTTMPNIFHSADPNDRNRAVDSLTHFLSSLNGPIAPSLMGGSPDTVAWGEELFHSIGCVACHGPQNEDGKEEFKPLGDLDSKTTVDALTQFLLDPHSVRASGRMPSLWLNEDEALAISVYLLRQQLDSPQSKNAPPVSLPGLNVDYYEIDNLQKLPDFAALEPDNSGTVDGIVLNLPFKRQSNHYALRFHGEIHIAKGDEYYFATQSDDGSALLIDGELVVDNDGTHGMQFRNGSRTLTAGKHMFELVFFNAGGGGDIKVYWRPGDEKERWNALPQNLLTHSGGSPMIPIGTEDFRVDASKASEGKQMFQTMRCASCHQVEDVAPIPAAKSLNELNLESADGCLSNNIRRGLPDYQLSAQQRQQIIAALKNRSNFSQPHSAQDQVTKTLATFNCYACHQRNGVGGPDDAIVAAYFQSINDIDLGEEGKIPPSLDYAGAKLKPSAIESILSSTDLHVRHYMKIRMPNFGRDNLAAFIQHIGPADNHSGFEANPPFSESDAQIGRRFVGTTGLACITCHRIAGQNALAIQGIDLATTYDRVNYRWFEQFLLTPAKFKKDTRMPQFWPDGESPFTDILNGDAKKQIVAIWSYLSLKNSLQLPEGITLGGDVAMEITPTEAPIIHRTFMQDVGPRAILTGFPEKLSTAFDANVIRLAKAWRGRFFDHSGVESGRTDKFLGPLGEDVFDLPAGPAFAVLDSPQSAWPTVEKTSRSISIRFLGYQLGNDRRPTFRYRLNKIVIEEKPEPILRPGGAVLKRSFKINGGSEGSLYFLAAQGGSISDQGGQNYKIDDKTWVQLTGSPTLRPLIRTIEDQQQLLVPIRTSNGTASFTQTIEW